MKTKHHLAVASCRHAAHGPRPGRCAPATALHVLRAAHRKFTFGTTLNPIDASAVAYFLGTIRDGVLEIAPSPYRNPVTG